VCLRPVDGPVTGNATQGDDEIDITEPLDFDFASSATGTERRLGRRH